MNDNQVVQLPLIDQISIAIGRTTAWLTLGMVLVTFVIVVIRYVFDSGFIWLQEAVTWMHATIFMLGAAYTMQRDEHVRVDIFYREMTLRKRAWVDLMGVVVFVFPLGGFFAYEAFEYVSASWELNEVSRNSGGLPYPFVPLLKSLLVLMPVAVTLQGVSLALKSFAVIRKD
jgi:TRAP-type mannitol/chloroaromatic compound transport system permease small subunit